MSKAWAFVRLGRPHFLVGPALFAFLGLSLRQGEWAFPLPADGGLAFAFIAATQLMVHYANDAWDLAADRANANRSTWAGGSRVLVDGRVKPATAWGAARLLALAALVLGAAWAVRGDTPIRILVAAATFALAWAYSSPPARLCGRGLGPFAVAAVVGVLVPLIGWLSADHAPPFAPSSPSVFALAILPLALAVGLTILLLDLPDIEGDRLAGKRSAGVRLGPGGTLLVARGAAAALAIVNAAAAMREGWPWAVPFAMALGVVVAGPALAAARRWSALQSVGLVLCGAQAAAPLWLLR